MIHRVIILILDGVGVGALPDAGEYGDEGSHTLAHVAESVGGLRLPTLEALGLGNISSISGMREMGQPEGCFGKMQERSKGKDSTVGHWEIAGCIVDRPFPTYPNGFPAEVIEVFEKEIGRKVLGNCVASGTEIIETLGPEHLEHGNPIVYTSADSVFQVAAHIDRVPVPELYQWCRAARKILTGRHQVARVIARPFTGAPGAFVRTSDRKDFSVDVPDSMLLDVVNRAGHLVVGIGKIDDVFHHRGITRCTHVGSNAEAMQETIRSLANLPRGLLLVNLCDFDSSFGHRNDAEGFAQALEQFDESLALLMKKLKPGDLLCITSDHGNDPTMPSTDHSREYVPLVVYGPKLARGINLGVRSTFADLGQTVADALGVQQLSCGESFFDVLNAQ